MAISPDHENARLQSLVPQFHCRTLILARRLKKYPPTALARQKKMSAGFGSGQRWRAHPNVAFFLGGQDYRHRLGMDRFNNRVRRRI
jgi:hypothetical protein